MRKLIEAVIRRIVSMLKVVLGVIEFGLDHLHTFIKNCERCDVPKLE